MLLQENDLTLYFQYPICDLRQVLQRESLVRPLPNWKPAGVNHHFLQYFGHFKKRRRGGHDYFHDELYFIGGRGGFKFHELEKVNLGGLDSFTCIYRRILNDRVAGARYEFGLRCKENGGLANLESPVFKSLEQFLDKLLCGVPVRIKNLERERIPSQILYAGKHLVNLYLKSTSLQTLEKPGALIKNGTLGLFIEYDPRYIRLPAELTARSILLDNSTTISHTWVEVRGEGVNVFFLTREAGSADLTFRNARVGLMRMYFEHQILSLLLNLAGNPQLRFNHDVLDRYLGDKVKYFEKKKKSGERQEKLHDLIFSYVELISPSEARTLADDLRDVRLQIKRRVLEQAATASFTYQPLGFNENLETTRRLIRQNEFPAVLDLLAAAAERQPEVGDKIALLRSRHHALEEQGHLGTISRETWNARKMELGQDLLWWARQLFTPEGAAA